MPFLARFQWVSPNTDELLSMAAALPSARLRLPPAAAVTDDRREGTASHDAACREAAEALLDAGVACVVRARAAASE